MNKANNISQIGIVALALCLCHSQLVSAQEQKQTHLFVLSGQSNMAGLDPDISFTPALKAHFESDEIIVVKDAQGGQPIRRWFKEWEVTEGQNAGQIGDLYDRLMKKVNKAIEDKTIDTVTFVWMQGERDAREKNGSLYEASLNGVISQLETDLNRDEINVVVGRLSDFSNDNKRYQHWTHIRDAQIKVADAKNSRAWVDTDDLNGDIDDLHYTKEGYKTLGERFAEKAIELLEK